VLKSRDDEKLEMERLKESKSKKDKKLYEKKKKAEFKKRSLLMQKVMEDNKV